MLDLSRLQKLRKTGENAFTACCPAHDDQKPSLSITRKNGKALFHCHAGCSQADVLAALRDVGAWTSNGGGAARSGGFPTEFRGLPIRAQYDYHDEAGNVVYTVFRAGEGEKKEFPIWCRGSWGIKAKGVKLIPYRLPKLATAASIFVTEGEKDVATVERMGLVATTSPGGAEKWRDRYADYFNDRHHVVILPDNDTAGRKHAAQVAASLYGRVASLKVLELPDLPEKADVSDWCIGRDPMDAGETLSKLADGAEEWSPEPGAAGSPGLVRLADVEAEDVTFLWPPYIPLGKLTLLEGDPGVGKSWLTLALAASLSVGRGLPGLESFEPSAVLIASVEDGLADTIKPRLLSMEADQSRIWAVSHPLTLDEAGFATLDSWIRTADARLVILDPMFAYVGEERDINAANQVRAVTARLAAIAEAARCAVLGIRHLTKGGRGKAIYRGVGSIDVTAAARSVLLAGLDQEDPGRRGVVHIKSNLSRPGPPLGYELTEGRFLWTAGPCDVTAAGILAGDDADRLPVEEAIEFLREALAFGPMQAKKIKRRASAAGISERTLFRAKARLKITSDKQTFSGEWAWKMPAEEWQS